MGAIGKLYELDVYTNKHCGTTSIEFTRKQTRKFTNTRWVKKYLKKYSYKEFTPGMVQYHDKIILDPLVYQRIIQEQELNKQQPPIGYTTFMTGAYA